MVTKCGGPSTCDNQITSPQLKGKAKYWDLLRYSTTSSNTASLHSLSGVDANSWSSGVESSTSGRVAELWFKMAKLGERFDMFDYQNEEGL